MQSHDRVIAPQRHLPLDHRDTARCGSNSNFRHLLQPATRCKHSVCAYAFYGPQTYLVVRLLATRRTSSFEDLGLLVYQSSHTLRFPAAEGSTWRSDKL